MTASELAEAIKTGMYAETIGMVVKERDALIVDNKRLREALVVAVDALKDVTRAHDYEGGTPVEALTSCKEALGNDQK
jgi:hypothetical protein